ncbi:MULTISPECIES: CDP-6-deoxy-delta-3,4-glucoseen reductase [Burkholderiaceae]|uniref:CDP-6-deoxy-delta-3,4-glucoseen reductase n=1 Tax=Burkholderiaceae TaxID=119060 RepID=UPI000963DA80|nr:MULTISPECIES: CDP-6-deoxy-delta-3,4-glucoseen reductase [Burkholderiaceae]MCF2133017.1 CDP-6-deoxy-delta-3,4-glucoseen reductase [Mycetohabitans sp. B3]MCG1038471.1 CDP-6-deoxy-delta-3,4-glucoseen reductase [Mycetohabitans sp. B7]SIT79912.1 CDP-4-dehydro-6-deoxyglucose reductase [Burkholderia sp. b14]
MVFNVTIRQSGKQFQVEADEPVLTAALRQGIGLPYGCKNGACGSCKGQLVNGSIEQRSHSSSALSNDEKTRGMALFCCATAQSDLEIDIREIAGVGDMQVKKLPCRVNALERVAHDVIVLKLQLPANERLQYLAGQYIEFILKDGTRRSYSMASAPHHEGPLELHIRHMPGGVFTDHVFGAMKERDILRFEGPLGTFFLREDADKPIVLLASGTGFAPIKAIIEHAIFKGITRPMTLYWGGRRRNDLYLASLAEQWAREVPGFKFVPVLSEPDPADGWQGRTGFVHRAVVEDLPDLSGYQVYACGAPVMVEAAQRDFTAHHGLPADEFYADSFTSAADLANAV